MMSGEEKPKNANQRKIRNLFGDITGARSRPKPPDSSNQSQSGKATPTATESNTDKRPEDINNLIQQIKDTLDVKRKEKWSYTNRHGQEIHVAERIGRVLDSLEQCAKIVDVAIQHHPEISALVWAGARFILVVARNVIRFKDELEAAIATTVEKMAACEYYAQIYHECLKVRLESAMTTKTFNDGLDSAFKELYAAVHAFLNKAMEYIDPGNFAAKKILQHLKPFSVTIQPLIQAIKEKEEKVKQYADMATMKRIKEDSSKLQEIQCIMENIRRQMEPLAKLGDIFNVTKENLNVTKENLNVTKENLNVAKENLIVTKGLQEFHTQVVQELQLQQRGMLSLTPLDAELQNVREQYMAESQDTGVFEASLYIPIQGMNDPHASEDDHFDLVAHVRDFLAQDSPQKVCLIQGVGGSGKSTFNHYLATELWDAYCKADVDEKSSTPIPVFIPLANVIEPNRHNQDLIADFFKQRSYWSDALILRARSQLRFVFILDGYDEIENRDRNFYTSNRLADWKAKIVITSRPEYLGEGYQTAFIPPGQVQLLREYWIAPFSISAMREFINKYVESRSKYTTNPTLGVQQYERFLLRPGLQSLISNPFLLKMVLTVDSRTITDTTRFNRGRLYQAFLTHWLEQGYERLLRVQLPPNLRDDFSVLRERDFIGKAKRFCLDFAVELYRHKVLQVEYDDDDAPSVWDNYLTDSDSKKRLLRYCLPLIRIGQTSYRFMHKSLRDFAIAKSIWQDGKFHTADALINEFHIVDDPGVIDFILEAARRDPALQQALLDCVNRSKTGAHFAQAASNAISILVRIRWQFTGSDLRGIRIRRADISSGWFDGAQLQNADLREVRAPKVWFRGANLTDARMDGIWFGEKPRLKFNLKENKNIKSKTCFYSAEGELLVAFIACEGYIHNFSTEVQVWSVSSRQLLHRFEGDDDDKLVFAPDGGLLASACYGGTIRLYGLHQSHQELRIFKTDFLVPYSLAFSFDGQLLALGSMEKPVELWSTESGNIIHTFPNYSVGTMAFSPDGKLLASGGLNSQVHVWSMEDYSHVHTFGDPTNESGLHVSSIAFSPDSQILASWHDELYLKLWSLPCYQLIDTLGHHTKSVHQICYAPDGQIIATLSTDNILRSWSVQSREVLHEFGEVKCPIAFSPDGQILAYQAADGNIRQWAISQHLGNSSPNTGAERRRIDGVAFWPNNKVLVSASTHTMDGVSARFWPLGTSTTTNYVDVKAPRTIRQNFLHGCRLLYRYKPKPLALNSSCIIASRRSGYILCWVEDNWPKYICRRIGSVVNCIDISPDGELIVCAGRDYNNTSTYLKFINRQSGEIVHEYEGLQFGPQDMAFSHDGQLLAFGDSQVIQFWSVPERRLLHTIGGSGGSVLGYFRHIQYSRDRQNDFKVAFSPDDQMVAFSGEDAILQLWSASMLNFKHLNTFEGHAAIISGIVFSPDGDIIVSGSLDGTLRFWSVRSMKHLLCIDTRRQISTLAWRTDPGNEDLAVGTEDGVLQLWRVRKKADYTPENASVEVSCQWCSSKSLLNASNLQIQGATGLDMENLELLKQIGAVGEPVGNISEPVCADGRIKELIE